MKKLFFLFVVLFGGILVASADDDVYAHDASVLPTTARSVIENSFKAKVSLVKIEKKRGRVKEYEVMLADSTEISFDSAGNWKNVEVSGGKPVPAAFIPQKVRDYVAKHHKGMKIVGIEKDRGGYDIELSDGTDIEFNKDGSFKRYDD